MKTVYRTDNSKLGEILEWLGLALLLIALLVWQGMFGYQIASY